MVLDGRSAGTLLASTSHSPVRRSSTSTVTALSRALAMVTE